VALPRFPVQGREGLAGGELVVELCCRRRYRHQAAQAQAGQRCRDVEQRGRPMDITELLAFSAKQGASDLHLSAGLPPMIRVDGDIRRINLPPLEHKQVHDLMYDIMNDKQRKDFEEFLETDFSFEVPGVARFRVNAFNQNRGAGGVFRTIPSKVLTMEDLGMGQVFRDISDDAARPGAGDRAHGLR
jgi:hypothetical protein